MCFKASDLVNKQVFIIQPTCGPVNDNVMELFFLVAACRRAGAKSVTVLCPYFGYARADRKFNNAASPINAAEIARLIEYAGVNRLFTVDLHSE